MTEKSSNSVPIFALSDKNSRVATFAIALNEKFLPMQLMHEGNANQSLPKFEFPVGFSLSANPEHCSNTAES